MSTLFNITPLLPALHKGELILTPNRRLTAKIHAAYALHQQNESACWSRPRVYSIEGWQQQLWDELQDTSPLEQSVAVLNHRQELIIWEQLITEDPESSPLLKPSGLAKHCQQALNTLSLWKISPESERYQNWAAHDDLLTRWHRQFEHRCSKNGFITQNEKIHRLMTAFQKNTLKAENTIQLLGFQDVPPLQKGLLNAASHHIEMMTLPNSNQQKRLMGLTSAEEEWLSAAQWVNDIRDRDSDASVAVVIPDLHQRRDEVERTFRRQLEQPFLHLGKTKTLASFNISIGQPLNEAPIISSALQLLSLLARPLLHENMGALLHSPFLPGFEKEVEKRVSLEHKLRRLGQHEYHLPQIISLLESLTPLNNDSTNTETQVKTEATQLSLLDEPSSTITASTSIGLTPKEQPHGSQSAALLVMLQTLYHCERPSKLHPSGWGHWAYDCLEQSGWPGDRTSNSVEYQQLNQWYELLGALAQFDGLLGRITFQKALSLINKETQAAIFQPQTDDSLLQILGPLEAAGLQFDYLWVTGLSDHQWPASPNPNPIIPIGLQRDEQMPHATAERELTFAKELIDTLVCNSTEVIGSYSQWNDDQPLRPSALVADFIAIEKSALFAETESASTIASASKETLETTFAPVVSIEEKAWIRGTSGLLKQQALCPFSAFAIHRLSAKPLEEPAQGLSALDRGNLIHDALEHFWTTYKKLSEVSILSEDERASSIKMSCAKALKHLQKKRSTWMGERFWSIESKRLENLLSQWIDVELERSSFTVFATEEPFQTELAGLEFRLRIDRIDKLDDDSFVLIDYKTGETNTNQWRSDRPKEPQLPLYAISSYKNVSAITFATVNAKKQSYVGLQSGDNIIASGVNTLSGKNADCDQWQEQIELWRTRLTKLVADFLAGSAIIDPLNATTYAYSGLAPLARLSELDSVALGENEDD